MNLNGGLGQDEWLRRVFSLTLKKTLGILTMIGKNFDSGVELGLASLKLQPGCHSSKKASVAQESRMVRVTTGMRAPASLLYPEVGGGRHTKVVVVGYTLSSFS